MTTYVRGACPVWWMCDLVGLPLNDQYYAFFLNNVFPYTFQDVFEDYEGTIPWSNPVQFYADGTLPNNIYFDANQIYTIEIRKGNTQNSPLIRQILNYVPGLSNSSLTDDFHNATNILTNPQFADINFVSPLVLTTAGEYNIAPGWYLRLTGAGTTTVTRNTIDGQSSSVPDIIPGNPPYSLTLNNSGWDLVTLYQDFPNNGAIFANGSMSVEFLAYANGSDKTVQVNYVDNSGSVLLGSELVLTGALVPYNILNNVGASSNVAIGTNAFVDIEFIMAGTSILTFANMQVLGQTNSIDLNNPPAVPPFIQPTYDQVQNGEFFYYKDSILNQPKNSLLAGWKFPLNPWHYRATAITNVATNMYTADQTIVIQQAYVDSATGNNVAVGQGTVGENYGFKVAAVTAHNQFAILNYIDPLTIRPCWNNVVSAMARLKLVTTHSTSVQFKVRLIYKAGLPNTVSQTDPIVSWTELSDPVAAAGYTLIAPPLDPAYTLTGELQYFAFNGFQLPESTNSFMTLGLLVYTVSNMNQTATADYILFDDVSLVQNDFGMPTQDQTFEEALRKCQYYFEYSWDPFSAIGLATQVSSASTQYSSAATVAPDLNTPFKATKRSNPTVTWYSTDGTINTIRNVTTPGNLAAATTNNAGATTTGYPNTAAGIIDNTYEAHWTADSRMGV